VQGLVQVTVAGVVPTQLNRVDVWAVATGKGMSINLADKLGFTDLVDFVGPNELLTGYPTNGGKVFRIWDLTTGRTLRSIAGPSFWERDSAALSPGRKYLAVTNSDKLYVYDLRRGRGGRDRHTQREPLRALLCRGMVFSPDGVELAGLFHAGADTRLISWDVATGKILADHRFQGDVKSTLKNTALYHGRRSTGRPTAAAGCCTARPSWTTRRVRLLPR
jgi:WD40 repeat protein